MENKRKIVIVDNEKDFCEFIKLNLEKTKKFKVKTATSGKKGIELIEKYHPDLILLDLYIPDLDGYQIAERLDKQEGFKETSIIFLTAFAGGGKTERTGIKESNRIYVSKTVPIEELITIIEEN